MVSYQQLLMGAVIFLLLATVFFQFQFFRLRADYRARRKYLYAMATTMVVAQAAMIMRIRFKDESTADTSPDVQGQIARLGEVEDSLSDLRASNKTIVSLTG